jgi:predicted glycosyltransferase
VRRYEGIKEDVYLADFKADPSFAKTLLELGITENDVLVTARPPASEALYHRFENELFDQLLERLSKTPVAKVILLPRNDSQRKTYGARAGSNLVLPNAPLDGANLIASSDLVVSAGGTMNREAAALGVPAVSIFLGEWAAIDEQLVQDGRLRRISTADDVRALPLQKKPVATARRALGAAARVADLILEP